MRNCLKILIGTVPYGRNNVGDEAILATVVASIRKVFPDAMISVSTDDPIATAKKLSVRTVPLFGFQYVKYSYFQLIMEILRTDIYVWGGATGLSDYPENALRIARLVKMFGKKLVLFSCGMNSEFNPAHYKLNHGKKECLLRILEKFIRAELDLVKIYENWRVERIKKKIGKVLNKADLLMVRDQQTKDLLRECGVVRDIYPTADPAVLIELVSTEQVGELWKKNQLWEDVSLVIGMGISAQREIKQLGDIVTLSDYLVEKYHAHILFIPMNPKTDAALMENIRTEMKHKEFADVLWGKYEPEEIAAIASKMALVISSRLHLLILSSISCVPIVGLSRGSKIDNYLKKFGEKSSGTVEHFDLKDLKETCDRLLDDQEKYRENARGVLEELKRMAEKNQELLKQEILE